MGKKRDCVLILLLLSKERSNTTAAQVKLRNIVSHIN